MKQLKQRLKEYPHLRGALANQKERLKDCISKDAQEHIGRDIAALELEICSINRALDMLGPVEKEIIKLRYFENLMWEFVAGKVGYSPRYCHRLHRAALEKMAASLKGVI